MLIEMEDGFNLTFAIKNGTPKNKFIKNKEDVIIFLKENLGNFDLLTINGSIIDIPKLLKNFNNYEI